jgi:hypothetical protein
MHGNVEEWCQDQWQENLGKDPAIDPKYEQGGKGSERVIRGGSWFSLGRYVRSAYRNGFSPDNRLNGIGLRLSLGQPSGSSRGGSRYVCSSAVSCSERNAAERAWLEGQVTALRAIALFLTFREL